MNTQSCGDPYPPFEKLGEDNPIRNHWQLCPKCQGTGLVHQVGWPHSNTIISTAPCTCDVCNGRKIISTITGLPPE